MSDMKIDKKKLIASYDLVHIKWHDAALHGSHTVAIDQIDSYGLMHGHVVGVKINETKDHVNIATDFFPARTQNERDTFRNVCSYPKSGIDKMTVLKTLEIYEGSP